jgi:hypothetical protein
MQYWGRGGVEVGIEEGFGYLRKPESISWVQ